MRTDPEVGTYFNPKLPFKGEGMSFLPEKRLTFVMTLVRDQTLIQNDSHIVARILFNSLVYQVLDDIETVKVIRMWTHYE
jgi:hypothetical protein